MPELPEVESYKRALARKYRGKTISHVIFRRRDIRYPLSPKLKDILRPGAKITNITRDGKQLVLSTQYGAINISLGMSGSFLPSNINSPHKHEHVSIAFKDKNVLGYIDPRRFGFWKVRNNPLPHFADPTKRDSLESLFSSQIFQTKETSIKSTLLDQRLIGGLGNIYILEALHLAHIRPTRKVKDVTSKEWGLLARIIPQILDAAINKGGSTIATYRRLHGERGNFQELHRVYQREGKACINKRCTGTIIRSTQQGRSSFYCPTCQT